MENEKLSLDAFKVLWFINKKCNYDCPYCMEGKKNGYNKEIQDEKLDAVCDNLLSLGCKDYYFSIMGGEPTIYPNFHHLIDFLYDRFENKIRRTLITTNFTQPLDYFKKFQKYKDTMMLRISLHPEYYNEEEALEKIDWLIKANYYLIDVHFMYESEYKDKIFKTAEKLKKYIDYSNFTSQIKYLVTRMFDGLERLEYTNVHPEDENEKISEFNKILKKYIFKKPYPVGKYCLVGSNWILLDENLAASTLCSHDLDYKTPPIYLLPPEVFKKSILKVKKCLYPYCKCCEALVPLIKSDNKQELINFKEKICQS